VRKLEARTTKGARHPSALRVARSDLAQRDVPPPEPPWREPPGVPLLPEPPYPPEPPAPPPRLPPDEPDLPDEPEESGEPEVPLRPP